jgi:hypothetical protein
MTQFKANFIGMGSILASLDDKVIRRGFDAGMSRAAQRAGTWINREVRKVYNVKLRDVRKAFKVKKAINQSNRRELNYEGGLIGIEKFSARVKTVRVAAKNLKPRKQTGRGRRSTKARTVKRKQVSFVLFREQGREVSQGTFFIEQERKDGSTAQIGIRRSKASNSASGRDSEGRTKKGRLPTTRVQGHAIPLMARNKGLQRRFNKQVQVIIVTEVVRAVNHNLDRAKRK